MEAKVDVRKLQILNDRINQTIDALNQVRVSVHGLGHTGGMPSVNPLNFLGQGQGMQHGMQQGFGTQLPYGFGAQGSFPGIGGQLGGQQGIGGFGTGLGFQHAPFNPYMNPYTNPFTNPFTPQGFSPWGIVHPQFTGTPFGGLGVGGIGGGIGGGLFHSNPDFIERQLAEARASDPYRISQTFPFMMP